MSAKIREIMTYFDLLQNHNITLYELAEKADCEYFKLRYFAMREIPPLEEAITKKLANFFDLSFEEMKKVEAYWLTLPLEEDNKIEINAFIIEAEIRLITAYEKWEYQAGNLKYWVKNMEEAIIQQEEEGGCLNLVQAEYLRMRYLYGIENLLGFDFQIPISYRHGHSLRARVRF